jgi:hypothetical protein
MYTDAPRYSACAAAREPNNKTLTLLHAVELSLVVGPDPVINVEM